MPSLLSDAEKQSLSLELENLAQTFERDIVVYKDPEKIIISTDINYNRFQANDMNIEGQNPTNSPQRFVIKARIWYEKQQAAPYLNPYVGGNLDEAQLKIKNTEGKVRIKVNPEGYSVLADAKLVEFDGFMFGVESLERPHGLFNVQYYTFWLKRTT
jgi:hypothetical protein